MWPLLMLGVAAASCDAPADSRRATAIAALAPSRRASFALSVYWTHASQPWAFFSLPTRAWELALGGLVAIAAPAARRLPQQRRRGGRLGRVSVAIGGRWSCSPTRPRSPALPRSCPRAAPPRCSSRDRCVARRGPAAVLAQRPAPGDRTAVVLVVPVALAGARAGGGPTRASAGGLARRRASASCPCCSRPRRSCSSSTRFTSRRRSRNRFRAVARARRRAHRRGAGRRGRHRGHGSTTRRRTAGTSGVPNLATRHRAGQDGHESVDAPEFDAIEAPVSAAIASAVRTRDVPSNLDPSLRDAAGDKAPPFVDGCDDSYTDTIVRRCQFGDTASKTTIVLLRRLARRAVVPRARRDRKPAGLAARDADQGHVPAGRDLDLQPDPRTAVPRVRRVACRGARPHPRREAAAW